MSRFIHIQLRCCAFTATQVIGKYLFIEIDESTIPFPRHGTKPPRCRRRRSARSGPCPAAPSRWPACRPGTCTMCWSWAAAPRARAARWTPPPEVSTQCSATSIHDCACVEARSESGSRPVRERCAEVSQWRGSRFESLWQFLSYLFKFVNV